MVTLLDKRPVEVLWEALKENLPWKRVLWPSGLLRKGRKTETITLALIQ